MMKENILSKLRRIAPAEQEFLTAISCLSSTELQAERKQQNWLIGELTKDIDFHTQSIKLFGKLKAEYIFKDATMRKQLDEIIVYHQNEIEKAKNEIRYSNNIIKRIDTPILTPDGKICEG